MTSERADVPTTDNTVDGAWLRFPPFPTPPPGVVIIPFTQFKPLGIQINFDKGEDEVATELDGLGIPTVTLRVRHDLTTMERRKRKKAQTIKQSNGLVRKLFWHEEWEDGEQLRRVILDPSLSREDRLHEAAHEFKSGRKWPATATGPEIHRVWEAFRLYIGLISLVQPTPSGRLKQSAQAAVAGLDDEDDDDDYEDDDVIEGKVQEDDKGDDKAAEAEEKELTEDAETNEHLEEEDKCEDKNVRMEDFLDNTETNIKIFLSWYFRDKGLVWSQVRCRDAPILLEFFLNFLLRSCVLPEIERGLRSALAIVERAKIELPATHTIGQNFPDNFSRGCEELWGNMTDRVILPDEKEQVQEQEQEKQEGVKQEQEEVESADEPDAKRRRVDGAGAEPAPEALPAPDDEPAHAVDADVQMATGEPADGAQDEPSWGEPADGVQDGLGWGEPADEPGWGESSWDAAANWGEPDVLNDWGIQDSCSNLMQFLGPTRLPLTHTTGIVEQSTRRIVSVTPPPATRKPITKRAKKGRSDADAVEEELEERLAKVVLSPWMSSGWELHPFGDVRKPKILADSRGAVRGEGEPDGGEAEGGRAPFDPTQDTITILVDPEAAEKLIVGMGIGATWIQIVRQDPTIEEDEDDANTGSKAKNTKKKGGAGAAGEPTKYWYMERQQMTLTSFHTEGSP